MKSNDEGAAVVEFAIVATLLAGFVFAIVEFSSLWNFRTQLTNESMASARYYAANYDVGDPAATAAARAEAEARIYDSMTLDPAATVISFVGDCGANPEGGITVEIRVDRPTVTGIVGASVDVAGRGVSPCI